TPIASSARYSTDVATIITTNSTNETANENFMTDHGSIRRMVSRARRGPRAAAEVTVLRATRTASTTRAAPTAGRACPTVRTDAAPTAVRPAAAGRGPSDVGPPSRPPLAPSGLAFASTGAAVWTGDFAVSFLASSGLPLSSAGG